MPTQLLSRPKDPVPAFALGQDIHLPLARVHEACGSARYGFALWLCAQSEGPVIWISPSWRADQLNADGIRDFTDPARFVFVRPNRAEDLLWAMEEVLRAGAVPLVVGDLPDPPGLTAVRRMHLAAETGAGAGRHRPLGLLLTPGDGGAQGVETRWHMAPAHTGETQRWHLQRRRARSRPPCSWEISAAAPGAPWQARQQSPQSG